MPIISQFYGIIIKMYFKEGEKHHKEHIHIIYNEYSAVYNFDGQILEGELPNKQKKLVSLTDELVNTIKGDIDILKQVETEEIKSILNNIIEKLDTKCKNCINLYYYENLSIKEVADKLEISESLVKYYLYQARNKIRSELEK